MLELDLVRRVTWRLAPRDEPLVHMLDNARAVDERIGDGLWVRLVDVPRARADRRAGRGERRVSRRRRAVVPGDLLGTRY
jgi:predicted acetyltransferase